MRSQFDAVAIKSTTAATLALHEDHEVVRVADKAQAAAFQFIVHEKVGSNTGVRYGSMAHVPLPPGDRDLLARAPAELLV
jgi:hypothetical protein